VGRAGPATQRILETAEVSMNLSAGCQQRFHARPCAVSVDP
jgi:hypothetical protein